MTDTPAATVRLDELYLLKDLEHQRSTTWALVDRQINRVLDEYTASETFVVLRIADKTLWTITTDVDRTEPGDDEITLTPVRMAAALAVAYVAIDDSGESMPVLAAKVPQLIRDHAVKPPNPGDALHRLRAAASERKDDAALVDTHLVATAFQFLQLRCIEQQGPADNVEPGAVQ